MRAPSCIFAQFFNDQMLVNYGVPQRVSAQAVYAEQRDALYLSVLLASGGVIVPLIDIPESPYLVNFLSDILVLAEHRLCRFAGSAKSIDEFLEHKRQHFAKVQLYPQYSRREFVRHLEATQKFWSPRLVSTSVEIAKRWQQSFELDDGQSVERRLLDSIEHVGRSMGHARLTDALQKMPDKIDGQALLWDIVTKEGIVPFADNKHVSTGARHLLGLAWLESHVDEYRAHILSNFPTFGPLDDGLTQKRPEVTIDFRRLLSVIHHLGLKPMLKHLNGEMAVELSAEPVFAQVRANILFPMLSSRIGDYRQPLGQIRQYVTEKGPYLQERLSRHAHGTGDWYRNVTTYLDFLAKIECIPDEKGIVVRTPGNRISQVAMRPRIFIIHGWAEDIRNRLELFLEKELNVEAIVMQSAAMAGKTLPEKFEALAQGSDYAIALLTADEELRDVAGKTFFRVRPNILLEIGFFWGLLSRRKLAVFVQDGVDVEIPNDLQGLGYQKIGGDFDAVKYRVRKELLSAGIISE